MFAGQWQPTGGYGQFPEDLQQICSRIARKELGIDVVFDGFIHAYKWQDKEHQYGRPLSLYVRCTPLGEIVESDTLRFFSLRNLPPISKMVVPHHRFFERYLRRNEQRQ